jgi:hypothetical protein
MLVIGVNDEANSTKNIHQLIEQVLSLESFYTQQKISGDVKKSTDPSNKFVHTLGGIMGIKYRVFWVQD